MIWNVILEMQVKGETLLQKSRKQEKEDSQKSDPRLLPRLRHHITTSVQTVLNKEQANPAAAQCHCPQTWK